MKLLLIILFAFTPNILSATTLDAYTRLIIPQDYKNVHQQVSYLIEPFHYKIIYDRYAPIEAKKIGFIRSSSLLDNSQAYPITTVILSILPDNVALVIDEKNKLVSFQYLKN